MEETQLTQTHFSNILSFLHRKNSVDGFKTLRNAIQIQLHRIKPASETDERKKLTSICPHCYTYWKEGNFSVKFKPKYTSGQHILKRMVLKCLICNHKEYQSYQHHKEDFRYGKKEAKPITKKNINTKLTSNNNQSKTKSNCNKQPTPITKKNIASLKFKSKKNTKLTSNKSRSKMINNCNKQPKMNKFKKKNKEETK